MPRCGVYSLARDYHPVSIDPNDESTDADPRDNVYTMDPYWIVAVIRLGEPLSFNRKTMSSDNSDLSGGALLRAQFPLVISDDCVRISVSNHKSSHTKRLSLALRATNVNYFIEILPDDWVFAWMMNNRDDYLRVLNNIDQISMEPGSSLMVNDFNDGLKFVGRVDDIFKDTSVDPGSGAKTSVYNVQCTGFRELDTMMFYDPALATSDAQGGNFGWMARFGVSTDALFGSDSARGVKENNINNIVPTLLDLIVGHGPPASSNISVGVLDQNPAAGARSRADNDPGFSYLVPVSVGNLLKKSTASKGVTSYADIIELWTGVQSFESKSGKTMFTPTFKTGEQQNRKRTVGGELLGTFLPFTLDFANRPLWSIFQQYVNPAINELYTALKVNAQGLVVPTVVFRQIPFSTDALMLPADGNERSVEGPLQVGAAPIDFVTPENSDLKVTRFLDLPRWHIPASIVKRSHVGRSNATRTNFVHVYGSTTYTQNGGIPIQYQMLTNPPVRDDVDIFRSGMHSYMTTVDCWVDDTVGKAPGKWMALIADWMMGSHLTLSGTIDCYGIQAPIAEGDNVSFDGVVYHVMSVDHNASIDPGGMKTWHTALQVTNGMRDISKSVAPAYTQRDVRSGLQPIYPGFTVLDNTALDPGLTLEQTGSTGDSTAWRDDPEKAPSESPLDPDPVNSSPSKTKLIEDL